VDTGGAPLRSGTVLGGTYRVLRQIGAGAMGEIYAATHTRLAGHYAVKVLAAETGRSANAYERFRREAEITSALRHPHIVQVIDFNVMDDGRPYLVMEFLDGKDLGARLRDEGYLALPSAAAVVEQVSWALAAAHNIGVTHRDLKPENIFCTTVKGGDQELVKVLDFGISKIKHAAKLTDTSALVGTPCYMSPEQARGGSDEVGPHSDQFALAAILYEVLSGRLAFPGRNVPETLHAVVHREPDPLATESGQHAVEVVIRKALSKSHADRYPSITEFARAVKMASSR
jgi:eukaryotic-like serine/threonine-protein kinase